MERSMASSNVNHDSGGGGAVERWSSGAVVVVRLVAFVDNALA